MDYNALADSLIGLLGGKDNIASAFNCMTRVRVLVRDDGKVRADEMKAVEGVLGVVHNQERYYEIVVGPGRSRKCIEVFRERGIPDAEKGEAPAAEAPAESPEKTGPAKRVLKLFGQIFAPLIPGIIAAGICAGVASLIAQVVPGYGDNPALVVVHNLLSGINAAFMTYLTAWAGYRAAEVFGGTPILGGMVGMFTTLGNVDAISAAVGLYDAEQPLNAILRAGRGGVLAAIIGVWLMCKIERALHKRMPEALDVVFTPILTLLLTLTPYVFAVMPAAGLFSTALCKLVETVSVNPSPIVRMLAGYIGAALFLPMVSLGMHHGLIALYTVQLEMYGYVTLYPALAMAGAGQVGAALAVYLKARRAGNQRLCHVIHGALPAGVLGIGEPLIYGVTLPLGKPFLTAGLGAGFGGAFVTLMEVASTTWGPSGLLGAFVMTEGPRGAVASVGCYLIGLMISCAIAYIITAAAVPEGDIKAFS